MCMFLDILEQAAITKCGLRRDQPILVGVSGGTDSLALMHGLDTLGFNLTIAHLDHALRPESAQDADFVQHLAESRGLTFIRQRIDVQQAANEAGQSLEETARQVRYRFLFEQARVIKASAVAVAHQADDQIETIIMHFLRGAALSGLSGMAYRRTMPLWDAEIPLVRPMLGIWREEVEAYVAGVSLDPRIDLTNEDTTYFRNRIRHELIPVLNTYNPQIGHIIFRMADVLRDEDQFMDDLAKTAWDDCFLSRAEGRITLHRTTFIQFEKALQRRVLRRALSLLRPDLRDVGFDAIERGLAFAAEPSASGEIDLVARLNLAILEGTLIVKTWAAELPDFGEALLPSDTSNLKLDVGSSLTLSHGWQIKADLVSELPEDFLNLVNTTDAHEAWLDFERLLLPLTVRGREPGDRWQPLGLALHTQKLHDFFINEKVPEHLRDIWPLVCSGDQIAWVVGKRPSELFKVTGATKHLLHLQLIQQQD